MLIQSSKVVVHDMTGNMGYPVLMLAMNNDWFGLLVEHYSQHVQAGQQMIVGYNLLTSRTYWVVRNVRSPSRPKAWIAELEVVMPVRVTVAGTTYGCLY